MLPEEVIMVQLSRSLHEDSAADITVGVVKKGSTGSGVPTIGFLA
jgi:hypothetical protein